MPIVDIKAIPPCPMWGLFRDDDDADFAAPLVIVGTEADAIAMAAMFVDEETEARDDGSRPAEFCVLPVMIERASFANHVPLDGGIAELERRNVGHKWERAGE